MSKLDVLGRDSNMRHFLPQADCFINNPGWWKKSSCNCCIFTQSMPLFPISAGLLGGRKNCQRHTLQKHLVLKKNTSTLFALFLIPLEFVVYRGRQFCMRLLMMGVNAPGLASKHTHMRKEEIWVNIEPCWQQPPSSKIFRPLGAKGNKLLQHFAMDSRCLSRRSIHFYPWESMKSYVVCRESLAWASWEKCL